MGGWDTHTDNFGAMKNSAGARQGVRHLLEDLAQRGLLASTMVFWYGEFGRTPRSPGAPWNGGRHHYPLVFSCVVAGGGFRGGTLLGSSDDKGEHVKDRPVYPWDLSASIYKQLGIEPTETAAAPARLRGLRHAAGHRCAAQRRAVAGNHVGREHDPHPIPSGV